MSKKTFKKIKKFKYLIFHQFSYSEMAVNLPQLKVYAWYDNEWGYSCRLADLTSCVIEKENKFLQRMKHRHRSIFLMLLQREKKLMKL